MPSYQYTALNTSGHRLEGVLAAASEQAVLAELESRQLVPVEIEERAERTPLLSRRVSQRRLGECYQQLGDLLRAGVPLMRGLRLLAGRKSNPRLATMFKELADGVSEGEELAESMAKRPESFPKVHIAMVRAGEKGGFLDAVFTRLGQFVLGQADMRGKVIGNLAYPAVLVLVGVVILVIVFAKFVPKFRPMFEQIKGPLPWPTRFMFAMSDAVGKYGVVTLVVAVLAGVGVWHLLKRPGVRRRIAVMQTRAPIVGPLVRALAAARFCRMLGTMLGNGIPLLAAMQIARDAAGNVLMEEAIDRAAEAVRAGQPLAPPLGESGLFGDDVVEMIAVAESANNLDTVLVTIAETVETRVDRLLSVVIRLVEPLLLVLLAGAVVFVAMGLVLPMMELSGGIE